MNVVLLALIYDPMLENYVFGAVKLTKNADIDKYGYFGYGIGFDWKSRFSFPGGGFGENVKKMYSINFTVTRSKFCLSLHYNGANSYLFDNGKEIHKFKAKDSKIAPTPLCLVNISDNWSVDNMQKTGLTLFRMGGRGGSVKSPPPPVFPCNLYKSRS